MLAHTNTNIDKKLMQSSHPGAVGILADASQFLLPVHQCVLVLVHNAKNLIINIYLIGL